jgi:hypothetical protein
MRTLLALSTGLLTAVLATGCQKASAPATATDQSRVTQPQNQDRNGQEAKVTESEPAADQPDDPGMSTAHDKTVKQEQPSGDESSRAAPNEGDAEPPQ